MYPPWVYTQGGSGQWTVGRYDAGGIWYMDNNYETKVEAQERCEMLNGGLSAIPDAIPENGINKKTETIAPAAITTKTVINTRNKVAMKSYRAKEAYSKITYLIDENGDIWHGPFCPHATVHWKKVAEVGIHASVPPVYAVEITPQQAALTMMLEGTCFKKEGE